MYDVCIIGAGINGCACAYYLRQSGKKVALVDRDAIAAGGSGAAGAFIAPKFSKGGELKELMDAAFTYSLEFYETNFPSLVEISPLLHIAKDEQSSERIKYFKNSGEYKTLKTPLHVKELLTPLAEDSQSVYLPKAALVNAQGVCRALAKDADFFKEEVKELVREEGVYDLGFLKAKSIILANGAYEPIVKEPYIKLRGVWGHRIDVKTSTQTPVMFHHFVSISKSKEGTLAVGATHNVHYHPQKNAEPYDIQSGRAELLEKASKTLELKDVEVLQDYTGLRSGSNDYLPLIGELVDSEISGEEICFYEDLYVINGVGGYGFVQGPYIAKQLCEHIIEGKAIDKALLPLRFYTRYKKAEAKKR